LPSLPGAQRYVFPEEPVLRRHRVPSALGDIHNVRSLFLCSHRAEGMEWPQLGQTKPLTGLTATVRFASLCKAGDYAKGCVAGRADHR
jgi:hypothetical protein